VELTIALHSTYISYANGPYFSSARHPPKLSKKGKEKIVPPKGEILSGLADI